MSYFKYLSLPTGYTTSYGPLNPRIGRWFIRLSEFNYKIEYQKGDQNKGRRKAPVLKVGDLVLVRAKIPVGNFTQNLNHVYPRAILSCHNRTNSKMYSQQVNPKLL
jgi:hypothetical protein